MNRGSSGATVEIFDTSVVKSGDHRVVEQGDWLIANAGCPSLPRVRMVRDGSSYRMERLEEIGEEGISIHEVFDALLYIWKMPCKIVRFDVEETYDHLIDVTTKIAPDYAKPFADALSWISEADQTWSLHRHQIHGDPTLENIMRRPITGRLVIIDPIPARSYAPHLRAVDLGKILQSSVGWEYDRYGLLDGEERRSWLDLHLDLMASYFGQLETRAALRFTLIHLLRALPYIDEAAQQRVLNGALREVADKL